MLKTSESTVAVRKPPPPAMRRDDEEMELTSAPPRPEAPAASEPGDRVTDGELLQRIADGDSAAFDSLYRRFARPILGLALRLLRDRSRAEDAVQETFAAIWRSAGSYRPDRGPGAPWLYAVARNAIIDRARARRDTTFADPPDTPSSSPGPAERAESSYVSWRVHRAVQELPPHEREVLELAYWGELSQSEVARFLDVPLGTVKTRTRSGLARLSDLLEGEFR
jgi:RNA polymerase sigma-70 factor (ECF subfamily)